MTEPATHVVTGASGYTGRYIARRLLDRGAAVRTLTGRPGRPDPFGSRVEAHPYSFDDPGALTRSLEGVDTLFNTYWIRFAKGGLTHDVAARNSDTLFRAARAAGVRRVVHVSITNAALDSALPYFRGKALVERSLKTTGLSHAILKPAIIFGREDILLNNIAWLLRRFPVHPIVGSGDYRVQPVFVEDLADLAVRAAESEDDVELDAVGPEVLQLRRDGPAHRRQDRVVGPARPRSPVGGNAGREDGRPAGQGRRADPGGDRRTDRRPAGVQVGAGADRDDPAVRLARQQRRASRSPIRLRAAAPLQITVPEVTRSPSQT